MSDVVYSSVISWKICESTDAESFRKSHIYSCGLFLRVSIQHIKWDDHATKKLVHNKHYLASKTTH